MNPASIMTLPDTMLSQAQKLRSWTKGTQELLAQIRAEYDAELVCRSRWSQEMQQGSALSEPQKETLGRLLQRFKQVCTEFIDPGIDLVCIHRHQIASLSGNRQKFENYTSRQQQQAIFDDLHRILASLRSLNNAMETTVTSSRLAMSAPTNTLSLVTEQDHASTERQASAVQQSGAPSAADMAPPPYRQVEDVDAASALTGTSHIEALSSTPARPVVATAPTLDVPRAHGGSERVDSNFAQDVGPLPESATFDGWYGQMLAALPAAQAAASTIPPGAQIALQSSTVAASVLFGLATMKYARIAAEAARVSALANTRNAVTAERLAAAAEQSAAAAMQATLVAEANAVTAHDSLLIAQQSLALAQKEDARKEEIHILDVAHRRAEEDRKAAKHPFELDQLRRQAKGEYKDASTQTATPSFNPIEETQREAESSSSASQYTADGISQNKGKGPLRCPPKHAELSVRTEQAIAPTLDDNRQHSEIGDIVNKSDPAELSSGTMATFAPVLIKDPAPVVPGPDNASQSQPGTASPASLASPLRRRTTSLSGYTANASTRQTSVDDHSAETPGGTQSPRLSADNMNYWSRLRSLLPNYENQVAEYEMQPLKKRSSWSH
ncbi:hypothetical protein B0A48_16169 [Cryoendolithus antarcticus]|uniref:Uncharacterized protein n=1 Tax=Cryoendolithus antarcticus TaxID=1507870 RepID=A0A1V8SFK7_9PEZI|nr:hypothetical protein B0A48_16169 [Cryoendolithus antarcticus]